jgi:hypothetical protein
MRPSAQSPAGPRGTEDPLSGRSTQSPTRVRLVVYQYCVSLIFVTWVRWTSPRAVRPGVAGRATAIVRGLGYSAVSLLLGWWSRTGGIWTIDSVLRNTAGGISYEEAPPEEPTVGVGCLFYGLALPLLLGVMAMIAGLMVGVGGSLPGPVTDLYVKAALVFVVGVDAVAFWWVKIRRRSS